MTGASRPAFRLVHAADGDGGATMRYELEGHLGDQGPRHKPRLRKAIRRVPGGYDVAQVDNLISRAELAVVAGGELQRAQARQALRSVDLNRRFFGYARGPVHGLVEELGRQLGAD